ncbi:hypothetical protein [Marinobacter sp. UBA3607]|uniref:hypothetical protein n=1 Tax=Marinobacter sp. UBA3607 TaxID=1946820 RepID=UPI00257BDEBF|nr:hypothetical protein [Marinobacter sp. UBA3607]
MSRDALINQGKLVYENIKNLDQATLLKDPGGLQPWNGLDFSDFSESYADLLSVLAGIYDNEVLEKAPFNLLHGLNSQLNAAHQHLNAFVANRAQGQFQNAFQHVENLRTHIQQWGFRYEAVVGKDLEERSKLIDDEITKLLSNRGDIEALKKSVSSLIEPAVAGSLSKSFADRKDALHINQNRWFWASSIMAAVSLIATIVIVWSIVGIFSSEVVLAAIGNSKNGVDGVVWSTIGLRVGALLPIYSIFAFSFLQYKKERDLEEEYAHKAAVATSLPNYGSLAVEDGVKDQILSEASKVIFTSPSTKTETKNKEDVIGIGQLNGLLSNIHKLAPKSKE